MNNWNSNDNGTLVELDSNCRKTYMYPFTIENLTFLHHFDGRDSAEASAEASVKMAEASGFSRTQF